MIADFLSPFSISRFDIAVRLSLPFSPPCDADAAAAISFHIRFTLSFFLIIATPMIFTPPAR
jgi:hypothetical protein